MTIERGFEIKALIRTKGITQDELADALKVNRSYLSEILNGKRNDSNIENKIETWYEQEKSK